MTQEEFNKLSALVVDDFSSFRSTMMSMLNNLGVKNIEEATRASEVIRWCKDRSFDVILCDYNLGRGKNGQHLLEELRFRKLKSPQCLFVMVTAEASKDMVLSAYECEPDDYLMKPLNLKVLQQRLTRLVTQRNVIAAAIAALNVGELEKGIAELEAVVESADRHTVLAQKLLGQAYLDANKLDEAEALYSKVLAARRLDWACLGLAKVHQLQGALTEAEAELKQVIDESRLYLPAYDALMELYAQDGRYVAAQEVLNKAVSISPKSILRQRRLAQLAERNGDACKVAVTSHAAIKLGELSCHKDLNDNLTFLKAAGQALEAGDALSSMDLAEESAKVHKATIAEPGLSVEQTSLANLLRARVDVHQGNKASALKTLAEEEKAHQSRDKPNIDLDLARHALLLSVGETDAADALVREMAERYKKSPELFDRVDCLLPEPRSERNRQRVSAINKEGIDHYKSGRFGQAVDCFHNATTVFPRHVSLQLNQLQSLIGQQRQTPDPLVEQRIVMAVEQLRQLDLDGPQATRFAQLREMARSVTGRRQGDTSANA